MRLVLLGCSLAWACAVGAEQLLTGAGDASLPSGVSEATTDTDTDRVNPNADQRSTAQPTTGRRRRKSKTTLAEIVGLRSAQARDAPRRPFVLPKLSLEDTLVGVFVIMIGGLLVSFSL